MPYSINFYQDQLVGVGKSRPIGAGNRILFVRFGEVTVNGESYAAGQSLYCGEDVTLEGGAEWSQLWRWEVDLPNGEHTLLDGEGVLSHMRMSRVITALTMPKGSEWLFRLDQITAPPGRVTDPHQHPGPGVRCLLEGTFNVQQLAESMRGRVPGEPWWETGEDTVIAWGSKTMHARFLRGMVLPVEHEGQATGKWLQGAANKPRGNWILHVDQTITV